MLGTSKGNQQGSLRDPSETTRRAPSLLKVLEGEDMVLRIKETKSEIPCRVSSDLHEWHNDLVTLSTMYSVKLQDE